MELKRFLCFTLSHTVEETPSAPPAERLSEESGVSSMFPLLHDAQVNGFKSDRISGLLVDFLPNRVGVFPLSLLRFLSKLRQEEGGHIDSCSLRSHK